MKALCPNLPVPRKGLDWRFLNRHRYAERCSIFYRDCLEYSNHLWLNNRTARAILCLDRAFGADILENDPILLEYPLPYAALVWMLKFVPEGEFIGNTRVHFQHYADRLTGPRREIRQARAWACWALVRQIYPQLQGDPKHLVIEPSFSDIEASLLKWGLTTEVPTWKNTLVSV